MTAPVQIRKQAVVRDIRELAELTHRPITEAVASAVRAELERARRNSDIEQRRRAVEEAVRQFREAPVVGPLLTDADFYDEDGLPR